MATSAVDYLILNVVHRTNEDWSLVLPLDMNDLTDATAICTLVSTNGARIELPVTVDAAQRQLVTAAESEVFEVMQPGNYSGDVLVTLSGGRDLVTHIINLELKRGISQRG
ncbi:MULTISPECIES: hypothetical protein [unclassified Methylobacterium]|uniref:hypothetical protein n=1 Tax=unclassified Methylobacterium TaxID=2615210 RepID=UPI0011C1D712|nr:MULTISPECIES: hypothetical protein [unclassified Methylobacterium]QEE37944.1 hypothetical protein FVA80_02165 [Methylobacterium sp. WL1]TXN59351.1 hypothetical protein FV241_02250 [Methylobacterium sp. WL2]